MDNSTDAFGAQPPLDEKLQQRLGERLRQLFAETARSPMPDRFSDLLDRLQQAGLEGLHAGATPPSAASPSTANTERS